MDAEHQEQVKKVEPEILAPIEENTAPDSPPQAYPDAQHQLSDVASAEQQVEKSVIGGEKSIFNLMPQAPKIRKRILDLHKNRPDLLEQDEQWFKINHRNSVTLITQRIRVALWMEFERALFGNRVMKPSNIFAGTCTESVFYKIVEDDIRFAYVLTPPSDYITMLKEAHNAGLEKLREIFSAQIIDTDGNLDTKSAEVVLKAFALIDARLKGAIIQRVDQRSIQLNAELSKAQQAALGLPTDMGELDKQLEKARAEVERLTAIPRHSSHEQLEKEHKKLTLAINDFNGGQVVNGKAKVLG